MRLFDARAARRSLFGVVFLLSWPVLLSLAAEAQTSDYFTVTPCRLYDSRWGDGPMVGGFDRWVAVGSHCGIPPDATAATLNVTAVTPTGDGLMSAYPCCAWRPNYITAVQNGNNIAGSAYLALGQDGKLAAYLNASFSTSAHLVVDVSGYFRPVSEVQQWREWEGTLTSPEDYTAGGGDPHADVRLDVLFANAATGVAFIQPAIWEGDESAPRIFKVYTALPAGIWTWAVDSCTRSGVSCLSGWTPNQGTILVQSNTASGNSLYDRGFVEQVETVVGGQTVALSELKFPDGSSFAWVGDTAWLAPVREIDPDGTGSRTSQTSAWAAYLADRKSKGFTAVQIAPAIAWNLGGGRLRTLPDAENFAFRRKNSGCTDPIPSTRCWKWRNKAADFEYWKQFKAMVQKANDTGLLVAVVGVMNPTGIPTSQTYADSSSAVAFAHYMKGLLGGQSVIFSPAFDDDPEEIDPIKKEPRSILMDAVGNELKGKTPTGRERPVTNHLASGKSNCDEYIAIAEKGWITHYLLQSGHGGSRDTSDPFGCAPSQSATRVDNAMKRARVMPGVLSAYSSSLTKKLPAINAEGPYDLQGFEDVSDQLHSDIDNRYRARQAAYLSALSNAVGYTYGAYGLTYWDQPDDLDSSGKPTGQPHPNEPSFYFTLASASDMTVLKNNLLGRHLIAHPDWIQNQQAIEKYKMVLASDNSSYVLAYLPGDDGGTGGSSGTIQIAPNLPCPVCPSSGSATWSFKWLNPTNGRSVPGGNCSGPKNGPVTFTRPNCTTDNIDCDWLLKIEKTGTCPSAVDGSDGSEAALQVWTAEDGSNGGTAVYAGETGQDGVVNPILLSSVGRAFQMSPRVSRLGSHHLVVWQADGLDGSLYGIYGSLVGPRSEVTGPFKINDYTEHDQREPAVAGRRAQEALVVWSSYGQDGDRGGIFGRLVGVKDHGQNAASDSLGVEFRVSEETTGHQQKPQVVTDADGYWVAWETLDEQDQRRGLSVRRFDRKGSPQAPEVRLEAPFGEQRQLLTLDRPGPGSVVLRWLRQDAVGRLLEVLEQEVGVDGARGSAVPGKD